MRQRRYTTTLARLAGSAATALAVMASATAAPSPSSAARPAITQRAATAVLDARTGPLMADGPAPDLDYWLMVNVSAQVKTIRACGWLSDQAWHCTSWYTATVTGVNGYQYTYVGWPSQWRRGKIAVYWNGGGPGKQDQCNTNSAYIGYLWDGDKDAVALGLAGHYAGPGNPEC
jgi:hypothetical protein